MIAAGYIRVSSRSQDYATQRDALERAAAARGDTIAHWFAEKRRGKATQRPELDELVAHVHRGEVRRLYVFRLDRLTRRGIRDTFRVVDDLHGRGCAIISTNEPWFDLEGPFADVILAVIAWAAQQELNALGERISAARTRVEAEGGHWGRPPRCDRATVGKIDALAATGLTHREIAQAVRVTRPTVTKILARKGPYAALPPSSQNRLDGDGNPPQEK